MTPNLSVGPGGADLPPQEIFEEVHRLILASVMREREMIEEALASPEGISSAQALEEENKALTYLLGIDYSVVADAYVELMKRFVALELREDQQEGTE